MRRAIFIAVLIGAIVAALIIAAPFSSGSDGYLVRGYFDNGGFIVNGEQVRVAGATVGSVDSVDVSMPGEAVHRDGKDDPGKAVVVMKITDPGFEDFRTDASCLIRPQSLLGEKFVDCTPTQPRAPGVAAPPELKVIPDGQTGAGQRFLPLENDGKQVDLDLVQNINRLPYAQRFRLILNDLGAGLAARGQDLDAIIHRADPALRETDQVLAILAKQNHVLANLARDSETALAPLARERQHLAGFIDNAGISGQATAERSGDLEAGLQKLPEFLSQLRATMVQLRSFSQQATPVAQSLNAAAPSLTTFTRRLTPFSKAGTTSLKSLGTATEQSTVPLAGSDPVVKQLTKLSKRAASPSRNLSTLLRSLDKSGGYKNLLSFVYNTAGIANGFDQFGHFLRAELLVTPCVDYVTVPASGCGANFTASKSKLAAAARLRDLAAKSAKKVEHRSKGTSAGNDGGSKALLNFILGSGNRPSSGSGSGTGGGATAGGSTTGTAPGAGGSSSGGDSLQGAAPGGIGK